MARGRPQTEHLLRRAAFGATAEETALFDDMSPSLAVDYLVDYERQPDDVDDKIGQAAYVSVTTRGGAFAPATNIEDARQRWLFGFLAAPAAGEDGAVRHNTSPPYRKVDNAVQAKHDEDVLLKDGDCPVGRSWSCSPVASAASRNADKVAKNPRCNLLDGTTTRQRPRRIRREVWRVYLGLEYTEQTSTLRRGCSGWKFESLAIAQTRQRLLRVRLQTQQHDPRQGVLVPITPAVQNRLPARERRTA